MASGSVRLALICAPEWACRLTRETNPKTWEIRGTGTRVRGHVGIIASGGGGLVGGAELVDSFPLTRALYDANTRLHQTASWEQVAGGYTRPHAWVFARGYARAPQRVPRKRGQVIWARLEA